MKRWIEMNPAEREAWLKTMDEAVEACVCCHCGRCVLCGPPCCQGKVDDLKAEVEVQKAKEQSERDMRREAKRQRKLARRAERRGT